MPPEAAVCRSSWDGSWPIWTASALVSEQLPRRSAHRRTGIRRPAGLRLSVLRSPRCHRGIEGRRGAALRRYVRLAGWLADAGRQLLIGGDEIVPSRLGVALRTPGEI